MRSRAAGRAYLRRAGTWGTLKSFSPLASGLPAPLWFRSF